MQRGVNEDTANLTNNKKPNIVAIIVTYHPDINLLSKQIDLLTPQVTETILVDNGSSCDVNDWNNQREQKVVSVITLGDNRGIAAAHNKGIEWAKNRGADYVLLMDQDSLPAPNLVEKLVSTLSQQVLPAAAGPRYLDERQNNPPPFIHTAHEGAV